MLTTSCGEMFVLITSIKKNIWQLRTHRIITVDLINKKVCNKSSHNNRIKATINFELFKLKLSRKIIMQAGQL